MVVWLVLVSSAVGQDGVGSDGERLFDIYCSACHQYDGGDMGEAPPLEGSPWVGGPPERLVLIVLHGVTGRIEMGGKVYDREMPGFGGVLSDQDLAALANYARARFTTEPSAVTANQVARIRNRHSGRTEYWQADELLRLQ